MRRIIGLLLFFICYPTLAAKISAALYSTVNHTSIGNVSFSDTPYGLLITPQFSHLPSGSHGFHLHQNATCDDKGMAAGGHFDPQKRNTHLGPYREGHLGDLPVLIILANGKTNTPLLAPRLKTSDLKGLTVMIHEGGDNYTDVPPLGGGGTRLACGIINGI